MTPTFAICLQASRVSAIRCSREGAGIISLCFRRTHENDAEAASLSQLVDDVTTMLVDLTSDELEWLSDSRLTSALETPWAQRRYRPRANQPPAWVPIAQLPELDHLLALDGDIYGLDGIRVDLSGQDCVDANGYGVWLDGFSSGGESR